MTQHEWDKDTPSKGLATCANCGMEVKTWQIRKGGLPTCDEFIQQQKDLKQKQTKLDDKPPCATDKRAIVCLRCPGRFDIKLCDRLRETLTPLKSPLSPKST